jgi:hypothetical protein
LCLLALAGCGGSSNSQSTAPAAAPPAPPTFLTHGGFNSPSDKLEVTFKLALYVRAGDSRGCYPAPARLVSLIRAWEHQRAGIAASEQAIHRQNIVYVISRGTTCNRLLMGLLSPHGIYVLDSDVGPVQAPGLSGKRNTGGGIDHLGQATVVSTSFRMSGANETRRLTASCAAGAAPLGGGMITSPSVGGGGDGVYPHSYERLGVQRGWHISATLSDPTPDQTTPRRVTVQAVCASGFSTATPSPHRTVFILPGETKSVTAGCPSGQYLYSGGFQRTDFRGFGLPGGGGDYITESRATGPTSWRVSGHAFGAFGGELTSIAYCVAHDRPLLSDVSASASVPKGASGTVTTPRCPGDHQLAAGGFSENGSQNGFFTDGSISRRGTWSAIAYAYFGSVPRLTAYGYCIRP